MIYRVYYSNIKLQSQIVVPVQTNKAQVCPHIYDNQPQKKKQKKHRKASAQSRVHSSSIFFFLLIRVPFVLIKHWQSSGGRNVANKSSQILCCCCRVHPRSTLSHPTQYHFSWLMIFVGGHRPVDPIFLTYLPIWVLYFGGTWV